MGNIGRVIFSLANESGQWRTFQACASALRAGLIWDKAIDLFSVQTFFRFPLLTRTKKQLSRSYLISALKSFTSFEQDSANGVRILMMPPFLLYFSFSSIYSKSIETGLQIRHSVQGIYQMVDGLDSSIILLLDMVYGSAALASFGHLLEMQNLEPPTQTYQKPRF